MKINFLKSFFIVNYNVIQSILVDFSPMQSFLKSRIINRPFRVARYMCLPKSPSESKWVSSEKRK